MCSCWLSSLAVSCLVGEGREEGGWRGHGGGRNGGAVVSH